MRFRSALESGKVALVNGKLESTPGPGSGSRPPLSVMEKVERTQQDQMMDQLTAETKETRILTHLKFCKLEDSKRHEAYCTKTPTTFVTV
jgi:hypothetical protein